ncbi:MAG: alginate O-acetyltransferase AlgX-related protein [Acidobacteriota bacterium]
MERSLARRLSLAAAILTSAVFVAAICVPATANLFKVNPPVPLQESDPNPMPAFRSDLATMGQVIYTLRRNWLDRNFGLRKVLVRWQQLLDVRVLNASMPNDSVLAGDGDWLYLAQENPQLNVITDYRAVNPLTQAQLQTWVAVFTARRDWLAAHGIRYMVVVAPNKASIYPEHIPKRFNQASNTNKMDQLVGVLGGTGVDIVDLRPVLREAKAQGPAYYRTDSHWTPFGAFFAYHEITNRLQRYFPNMRPVPLENYLVGSKPGLLGGLSYMIAMGDLYQENIVLMEPKSPRRSFEISGKDAQLNHFQPLSVYENPDKSLPRAFVIRDSFVHEIIPFLAEHFSRMYFVWPFPTDAVHVRTFDTEAILREKPDIVIDEFVERYFTQPPPPSALSSLPRLP